MVILGHVLDHDTSAAAPTIKTILGLVAMPTFFVVSGLTFKPLEPATLISRRVRSTVLPYFAFLTAVAILVSARDIVLNNSTLPSYAEFLWGGAELKGDFGTFWFLSAFFFTQIIYNLFASRGYDPAGPVLTGFAAAMLLIGSGLTLLAPEWALPLSLDRLPYTIPLFWFGHLLQREEDHKKAIWLLLIVIAAICLAAAYDGAKFGIKIKNNIIDPPVLGLLLGFVMARLALTAYRLFARMPFISHLLAAIGEASLVILCLHQFVHFTLRRVGVETSWILVLFACSVPFVAWLVIQRISWMKIVFLGARPRSREPLETEAPAGFTSVRAGDVPQ